ncbi:helix-turn-helix transcriptional regulator [Streptomyces sp. NBC_01443]|uniref:helix-turn-helix domain-containing protein n=1 Tax=Streptomyces sp. NBC_01443 TaxID=2903868 RepID=UPI002B1CB12E|nr:helix-turn-helix transcriptional regulator [Streptomyces sp. NBC_01443]MCX4633128.1 helix-turn-helix domain-containing protein [Streptomyces sp. NBC_01443]
MQTVRRRRLGSALRDFRVQAGMNTEAASAATGWDGSKINRIENAKAHLPIKEVAPLLNAYGITDEAVVTAMEELARDANKVGWWNNYGDLPETAYKTYVGLEEDADSTRVYTPGLIPGLLQIPQYAREIITATAITRTTEEVTALVEMRKKRQAILVDTARTGGPLDLWAVIHESTLHYKSASYPALMRDQLRHLLDMADLPNVRIQVMPIRANPHPGMVGPFHIVRFPQPWPTVVMLENIRGGSFAEGVDDVKVYEAAYELIQAAALPVNDSREKIRSIMEDSTS